MQTFQQCIESRAKAAALAKQEGLSYDTAIACVASKDSCAEPLHDTPLVNSWEELVQPSSFDVKHPLLRSYPTFDLIAYLAHRAFLAYEPRKKIEEQGGTKYETKYEPFEKGTDAAFAYLCGRTAVVAIRGTRLTCLRQWFFTNLLMLPCGQPLRHWGFKRAWQRLRDPVKKWIEAKLPQDGDIILTGHSLGGAVPLGNGRGGDEVRAVPL